MVLAGGHQSSADELMAEDCGLKTDYSSPATDSRAAARRTRASSWW
jgi:hypothetical protein